MKQHRRIDGGIAEQAAGWLRALERGGPAEQAAFAAWLKESPRHIEEVLCATAVSKALDRLDARRWPDVSQFLADASANASANVVPLAEAAPLPPVARGRKHRRLWACGLAAALVGLLGWWGVQSLGGWEHYSTVIGEQRALTLEDGSLAHLNTRSRVDVRFTPEAREVRLVDGEALFKVEHDPARPFLVRTGDAVIRAVGTQFNVQRRADGAIVSVIEGIVEISTAAGSPRFTAGQQARVTGGGATQVKKVDVARTTVWRQRRLVFELDPLAEVAREFNRYNHAPRIIVEGEAARRKRFSGVFDADDPHSLTGLLATYTDLAVEERDSGIVVRSR